MARINISVPDDVKEGMDQWQEVNWSGVAQEAFVTRIEIEKLKGSDMSEAGLARLRASKKTNQEREHAEGLALGKQWALESADYDQLKRVVDLRDDLEDGRCDEEQLLKVLIAVLSETGEAEYLGESPSASAGVGFVDGAFDVFKKV